MPVTTLTITDLTRMSGNRVCIAGITDKGRMIRPEFENAIITEDWLFEKNQLIIKPFMRVKFKLIKNMPDPPHTEDWIVDPKFRELEREISIDERCDLLESIACRNVTDIFDTEIQHEYGLGYFVKYGEGTQSLGTLAPFRLGDFTYTIYDNKKLDYRLGFLDWHENEYRLGITDLALRNYVDHLRIKENMPFGEISDLITDVLQHSQVFLRIGLARATNPRNPGFCSLQINGVYTFPDYLDDRCFADFN